MTESAAWRSVHADAKVSGKNGESCMMRRVRIRVRMECTGESCDHSDLRHYFYHVGEFGSGILPGHLVELLGCDRACGLQSGQRLHPFLGRHRCRQLEQFWDSPRLLRLVGQPA